MGIWIFYVLALIPAGIGGFLWIRHRQVVWWEWLAGSAIGFVLALVFQFAAVAGMTGDKETWSGYITQATHWPEWVEEYEQMHTRQVASGTDAEGNTIYTTEIYYTTEYRTHREHWVAYTSISDEHDISEGFFREITGNFGGKITTERPYKSGFYSGDRNAYVAYRRTDYLYPVTSLRRWENRVKAAPTLFSFSKPPEGVKVFSWPGGDSGWRQSNRLLGTAASGFDILEFDRMNARLGSAKRVNVIIVGFGDQGIEMAEYQRAAWLGGKKNDLVLCYGGADGEAPAWAKVFGWSDSDVCKRNLETILMAQKPCPAMLAEIEAEIVAGYTIKDWSAFDYITVEPPTWSIWVYLLVAILVQGGFYFWAHGNEVEK